MDGIGVIDQDTLTLQIKSLIVFDFLNEYNELERIIRNRFEQSLSILPNKIIQQLYFYYGGRIGTFIEYEETAIKLNNIKYTEKEKFKELSINQIIKIFKNNSCLAAFNFSINSIQRSTTDFSFYDCIIRLLNMRNKLAHEVCDLKFKDKDLIELLSYEQISNESFGFLKNYDIQKMDNMTQYIASNIVYIRRIISKLKETNCSECEKTK